MKKSRFSDSQILSMLKQAESGVRVSELCREHGMSSATFPIGARDMVGWMPPYGLP